MSNEIKDWVLVPAELTDAMRDAGNEIAKDRGALNVAYRAMLQAAPTPPAEAQVAGGGDALAWMVEWTDEDDGQPVRIAFEYRRGAENRRDEVGGDARVFPLYAALSAQPRPASAPVGVAGESVAGYIDRLGERIRRGMSDVDRFGVHGSHGKYMRDLADEAIAYAKELAQQPRPDDGEAVGWAVVGPDGKPSTGVHSLDSLEFSKQHVTLRDGHRYAYVYLHPAPDDVARLAGVVRFLCGVGELDGRDFGDEPPRDMAGRRQPFWWREHLREATAPFTAAQQARHD